MPRPPFGAVALLIIACVPPVPPATPGPGIPLGACERHTGQRLADGINQLREAEGLPRLRVDVRLVAAAEAHSEHMAVTGAVSHAGAGGSGANDRVNAAGYDYAFVGENVAAYYETPASVLEAWMTSPGHRDNILATRARHLGAGRALDAAGRPYWTLLVANSRSTIEAPLDGCHPRI